MDKKISIEGMVLFVSGLIIFIMNKIINGTYTNKLTILAFLLFIIGIILMYIENVENNENEGEARTGKPTYSFHNFGE